MSFIEVATTDELRDGNMKMVRVDGREILLARVGDKYYSADNRCPHMGGNLSQGRLEGTLVTCPKHHSQFDLADGHVIRWTDFTGIKKSIGKLFKSSRPLKTYQVKVEDEKVLVDL
jgi:3-phenylpropionate/trans-cinnamate dioxygenase ferredoxin component